jgi:hypothetical protein
VEPRTGLDDVEKRKFLTLPDSKSDPSVFQPVASCYTDGAIPADGKIILIKIIEFEFLAAVVMKICIF